MTAQKRSPVAKQRTPQPKSVRDRIRDEHARKTRRQTVNVELPGWPGVFVKYRALTDYSEFHELQQALKDAGQEIQGEIDFAVGLLLESAVECFAEFDGERTPLPDLGLPLYNELVDDDDEIKPGTDEQALSLLFPGTALIVAVAGQLTQWFEMAELNVAEDVAKNL